MSSTTYQLYCGRNIPQAPKPLAVVSYDDFADFLDNTVSRYFESWTVTEGVSCWKGVPEDVFIITIISDEYEAALEVRAIANLYKQSFSQEAVLINSFRSDSLLV
jgi:hypothetical protein